MLGLMVDFQTEEENSKKKEKPLKSIKHIIEYESE